MCVWLWWVQIIIWGALMGAISDWSGSPTWHHCCTISFSASSVCGKRKFGPSQMEVMRLMGDINVRLVAAVKAVQVEDNLMGEMKGSRSSIGKVIYIYIYRERETKRYNLSSCFKESTRGTHNKELLNYKISSGFVISTPLHCIHPLGTPSPYQRYNVKFYLIYAYTHIYLSINIGNK